MTNMKPSQLDLQLQNSNMDSEITTKVSCFYFKQQMLSILHDDNIMNSKNLIFNPFNNLNNFQVQCYTIIYDDMQPQYNNQNVQG